MSKNVLVFDFGTSSSRAMLSTIVDGKINLTEVHRFENIPVVVENTLAWDIDNLFEEMKTALHLAVFLGGFEAISIDTWGVDFGLINRKGDLMGNPVHYRDERTTDIFENAAEFINLDELYQHTGMQSTRINTLFQLLALKNKDTNILFTAEKMLMMPDLFAYLLTGAARTEYTIATTTQLINPTVLDWDYDLIDKLQLPRRIFTPIIHAGESYGVLKDELCYELKCSPVPVYACASHDTASAVVAVPVQDSDFVFINCGTQALFGTECQAPVITPLAREKSFSNEGGYGGTTTLQKNIMGLWLIQACKRHWKQADIDLTYSDIEKLAMDEEPFKCFINPNHELFLISDDMPLKIQSFCEMTKQYVPKTQGEILRCIYDSLVMEFVQIFKEMELVTQKKFTNIIIINGRTKDTFLCAQTADAIGLPVISGPAEATALGNAISTMIAIGELNSVKQARKMLADDDITVTYNPKNTDEWQKNFPRYEDILSF